MKTSNNPMSGIKRILITGCGVYFLVLIVVFVAFVIVIQTPTDYYETTNPDDYGNYVGNNDNIFPARYINSFFPDNICEDMQEVVYSYKAENADSYGFEAYLEFKVVDSKVFYNYIDAIAPIEEWKPFEFDGNYMEYTFDNELVITEHPEFGEDAIEYAQIGKVLYCANEQRLIYVAICVYDGGGASTSYLCTFFERFMIDPSKYAS